MEADSLTLKLSRVLVTGGKGTAHRAVINALGSRFVDAMQCDVDALGEQSSPLGGTRKGGTSSICQIAVGARKATILLATTPHSSTIRQYSLGTKLANGRITHTPGTVVSGARGVARSVIT